MDNRQNALIEVEGLKKFYKNRGTGGLFKKKKMVQAVGGVSFEIRKGEIFGVIGESGCGKSTMGRTLVNLEAPTAGDVRINGESARAILQKDPKAFHQMVQMVFQNPFDTFLPTETIEQIMLRPLEINGLGGSEEERRRRIVQLLEDGGLSPAEAAREALRQDRERARLYGLHTGAKWGEVGRYDLTVDSGPLGVSGTVELLSQFIALKTMRRRSKEAAHAGTTD